MDTGHECDSGSEIALNIKTFGGRDPGYDACMTMQRRDRHAQGLSRRLAGSFFGMAASTHDSSNVVSPKVCTTLARARWMRLLMVPMVTPQIRAVSS